MAISTAVTFAPAGPSSMAVQTPKVHGVLERVERNTGRLRELLANLNTIRHRVLGDFPQKDEQACPRAGANGTLDALSIQIGDQSDLISELETAAQDLGQL